MEIDKKLVKKIASLSKINVDEGDVEKFSKELSKIINWVEKLNEVKTENIKPVTNPSDIKIPTREDKVNDGKIEEKILKNAPEKKGGYFTVPKVVE
tara:strand:+ start:170 stop:457 length:288 start_codon:yes stop_codon:yes gene_type:complete